MIESKPTEIEQAPLPDNPIHQRYANRAVNIGLSSNILLSLIKVFGGVVGHSQALLADGINSTSDVAYYIAVKICMRLSRKPADDDHPYGHSQMESIAALIVGSFVLTTAIAIFWQSISDTFDLMVGKAPPDRMFLFPFMIASGTVLIKIALYFFTSKVGNKTRNAAITALAFDHRNDVFSASAAATGIFLAHLGYEWVDPMAGALVALFILRTGIRIIQDSAIDLMDTLPNKAIGQQIRAVIQAIPEVKEVEEIHAHRFGPYLVINISIGIDGNLSVARGDSIATEVERRVYRNIDLVRRVYVHFHPSRKT